MIRVIDECNVYSLRCGIGLPGCSFAGNSLRPSVFIRVYPRFLFSPGWQKYVFVTTRLGLMYTDEDNAPGRCRIGPLAMDIDKELSMRVRRYARQSVGQDVETPHEMKNSTTHPTLWRA